MVGGEFLAFLQLLLQHQSRGAKSDHREIAEGFVREDVAVHAGGKLRSLQSTSCDIIFLVRNRLLGIVE